MEEALDSNFQKRTISLFITVLVLGVLLAFLRPFGTDDLSFWVGTGYWMGLFLAGFMGILTVDIVSLTIAKNVSYKLRLMIYAVVVTGLTSAIVIIFHGISGWQAILLTFVQTAVISAVVILVREYLSKKELELTNSNASEKPTCRLKARLPLHLQSSIIYALNVEDHYVRIITSSGEHLVLMRLSDAISEMDPVKGLSTHRSWWVAENGIEKVKKSGRAVTILLKSGTEALVSRSGAKLIKEAGWI